MNSPSHLPVHHTDTPEQHPTAPTKRHHSARYYAHRVKESLTTRVSKLICAIFLSLLLIIGIITFILWLSLRPHRPRFFIHDFTVTGLSLENGFESAQIVFNATARNSNLNIGIYYDAMSGSVYYKEQKIGSTPLLDSYYEGPKTTKVLTAALSGATLNIDRQRWMEISNERSKGVVVFRLEITSTIRFRISAWDSKRHVMHANCPVSVGSDGMILPSSKDLRCPVYFT
ncbi:NDR1/HIN1-like protein 26 [Cucumis sativus]|uniref:Late embryogenesis abundant protein LEA-2 subgroup domain-containing protein n=1 Tax=Cucumis sativus TaxID=3659 RepID=A0A0A0LUA7_CUCSA|nr:NDR1/HIN1-like protein 26 [Cucumis sativus]KGN64554.1 hypothetical protein Csa_013295 [Cucumis sativus]